LFESSGLRIEESNSTIELFIDLKILWATWLLQSCETRTAPDRPRWEKFFELVAPSTCLLGLFFMVLNGTSRVSAKTVVSLPFSKILRILQPQLPFYRPDRLQKFFTWTWICELSHRLHRNPTKTLQVSQTILMNTTRTFINIHDNGVEVRVWTLYLRAQGGIETSHFEETLAEHSRDFLSVNKRIRKGIQNTVTCCSLFAFLINYLWVQVVGAYLRSKILLAKKKKRILVRWNDPQKGYRHSWKWRILIWPEVHP